MHVGRRVVDLPPLDLQAFECIFFLALIRHQPRLYLFDESFRASEGRLYCRINYVLLLMMGLVSVILFRQCPRRQ